MTLLPVYIVRNKYNRILLCFLLVACFQRAAGQEDYDTAVVDTAIAAPDVEVHTAEDTYQEKEYIPDTPSFRTVPDSVVNRLKRDKAFEYANDATYWSKKPEEAPVYRKGFWDYFYEFFSRRWVRNITYVLIGILFLFVIYRVIVQNNLYLFYSSRKIRQVDEEEVNLEEDPDSIDEKIHKAIEAKDHRVAVRYLYIKLLQSLHERGGIRYHAQATNHDYVLQMSGHKLYREFSFLTEVYDYVWYGEFSLTDDQFNLVHTNFKNVFEALRT